MPLPKEPSAQVAVLIDGDNLSPAFAGTILHHAARFGGLRIKRVYGNATRLGGWLDAQGVRVIHAGQGKNAADILVALDAVDLLHQGQIDHFILASSDSDFSHIAHRLREGGAIVTGIGCAKAPESFRQACTSFHEIGTPPCRPDIQMSELDRQIYHVITKENGRQSVLLNSLNAQMRRHFDVKISQRPEKTWGRYLKSKPELYRCEGGGQDVRVVLISASL